MSRTQRNRPGGRQSSRRQRHISVRSVQRDPIDLRKLGRAVIALAQAQAEAEAQAQAEKGRSKKKPGARS